MPTPWSNAERRGLKSRLAFNGCYKLFKTPLLRSLDLKCTGFEFCPEVTAKILLRGIKIHELPISYYPRRIEEGKKINWIDGVIALWTLFILRFQRAPDGRSDA